MQHEEFKKIRLGKSNNYDGGLGEQCVDLAKQYADNVRGLGKIGVTGDAGPRFRNGSLTEKGAKKVIYTKGKVAPRGSLIFRDFGTYGHVAIVDEAGEDYVQVVEQNGRNNKGRVPAGYRVVQIAKRDYRECLGWIVDPETVILVKNAMEYNSKCWEKIQLNSVKDALNNANEHLRKYFK